MNTRPSAAAQSKGAGRRFWRWRSVLLGIVCLIAVFLVAVFNCPIDVRRAWLLGLEYDKAMYARISKAIAGDPRHLSRKRLYDFIRELDLEDIPWDDANVQNWAGSFRIYHFRGFMLSVNLYVPFEHQRHRGPERILLEQGSLEEKRQARDWLLIESGPFALIDGINSREERMRKYWAEADEEARRINEEMHSRQKDGLNLQSGLQRP
jgi:hypothetical protein